MHNVIINECLGFYDLKSNKRYIFVMNSSIYTLVLNFGFIKL